MNAAPSPWPTRVLLALVLALQVASLASTFRRREVALPRWEYELTVEREGGLRNALAAAGSQGWEVVSVRRVDVSPEGAPADWRIELVMKRQLLTSLRVE